MTPCGSASWLRVNLCEVPPSVKYAPGCSQVEAEIITWAVYRRILASIK